MTQANGNVAPQEARRLMPVGFVGHGSPMNALEEDGAPAAWHAWGESLPRPRAILIVSAHWLASPPIVGAEQTLPLIYDFYGFPQELYQVRYRAPGAPDVAQEVFARLEQAGLKPQRDPKRGLDHGAWVPLTKMFPAGDIPVVQVSIGTRVSMADHVALARALAPLRAEGVFILGSGNITHNLRLARFDGEDGHADAWAKEFDAWCTEALEQADLDTLADYMVKGPGARLSVPTDDHYTPFFFSVAAGTDGTKLPSVRYPHLGFQYNNISMRCVEFS